jgi:hypothetical protein
VHRKIVLILDELDDLLVQTSQWVDDIMPFGITKTGNVKKPIHRSFVFTKIYNLNQPVFHAIPSKLNIFGQAHLLHDPGPVGAHGFVGDRKFVPNFQKRFSIGKPYHDLKLTARK